MATQKLGTIIETIKSQASKNDRMSVGDVIHALEHRGFGPLLIAPALFVIMPTGAIPGVPAICAIIICLLTGQIMLGKHRPWLPHRVEKLSFRRQRLIDAMQRATPLSRRIDNIIHPRLQFFMRDFIQRFLAFYCFLLGLCMMLIGFIPFLPALLALPILFFALGMSARDGLMILLGLLLGIGATCVALYAALGRDELSYVYSPFLA